MSNKFIVSLGVFALFATSPAWAEKPSFGLPIDCKVGEDCWIVNYVDVNPDEGMVQDFKCGSKTYDGHKGTDFAVRSMAEVREGVDVLAAMDGTVLRIRDGEDDNAKTPEMLDNIRAARKECGNAVLMDHGRGLHSMFCHLKNGSVRVKPGDEIEKGDVIGQVGQSGLSEFPHVHFGIVWEEAVMDPFTGENNQKGCGMMRSSLWDSELNLLYQPLNVFDLGFTDGVPDFKAIQNGQDVPVNLPQNSEAFVFWFGYFGARHGDKITLKITDPDGRLFATREIIQDETRIRQYYYTGRRTENTPLKPGLYSGLIRIERDREGQSPLIRTRTRNIVIQ